MNLLGAIEKNAAMWDKLLSKGFLGVDSVKRLTALAPTDLPQLPSRLMSLSQIPSGLPSASSYLKNFRGLTKLPSNPLPQFVGTGFSKNFLEARNTVRGLSATHELEQNGSLMDKLMNILKPKQFEASFKPNIARVGGEPAQVNDYKSWFSSIGGKEVGPSYDPVPNVLTKFNDPISTRHELGHFFDFNRMAPETAARVRQRIVTRAQEHYPELLYKAKASGAPVRMLNEAVGQGIAASGKSPAAQRFRSLYNSAPNKKMEDQILIDRANKIDPTGRDAAVINHLLHNYRLNQF